MGKKQFTIEEINDIKDSYVKKFISVLEISKQYKCDGSVISRILKENNIEKINGSAFNVNYWVKRGMKYDDALYKIKTMKPCLVEYWLVKGFTLDESKFKVELHLMNTERAFVYKFGEEDGKAMFNKRTKLNGENNSPRSVKYWLNRGYNEIEATEKIKEVQTTFTLEKCIKKHGEIKGNEIYSNRQNKWVNTIKNKSNIDEINSKKNSVSLEAIMERSNLNYVDEYYRINLKNGNFNFLKESVKNNNYIEFLDLISKEYEYSNKIIHSISKIKLFQYVFKKTKEELKIDLIKLFTNIIKQKYGTLYYVNGVVFRSLGERDIFLLLSELNINFIYDKKYNNNTNLRYDFYLIDYSIYIEYFGMLNVKENKINNEILKKYRLKCQEKKEICVKNNYKHFFSSKIENILKFINNLKNNDKENNA